jgi:regulatory protein
VKPVGPPSRSRSLKARALQWLAQREHSRGELQRKLLPLAQAEAARDLPPAARVEALLDWLEANRYLSQQRFAESRAHARAARYGNLRIRQELAQHGVALSEPAARELQGSELERARAVWSRKFAQTGSAAADVAARAKQARFMAGRGFSADVVRRVLREAAADALVADVGDMADGG